ncbi:hypothetical protein ACNQF7_00235 [Flavobacterium sp. RSP29]|uniref:hypothetical protein n=1 Tax=Flavobacterium sp. RSP29 TaxID=3401731 RepID=UPI003AB0A4F2
MEFSELRLQWKAFAKAVLVFLDAAERPKEAPVGTLEKQTDLQKLAMKSGKSLLKFVLLQ